jgi:hypothetical protein
MKTIHAIFFGCFVSAVTFTPLLSAERSWLALPTTPNQDMERYLRDENNGFSDAQVAKGVAHFSKQRWTRIAIAGTVGAAAIGAQSIPSLPCYAYSGLDRLHHAANFAAVLGCCERPTIEEFREAYAAATKDS